MQMDIHATPEFFGQAEHRIDMALRVAIDRTWVQSAHRLGAKPQRLFQQFDCTGSHQHAALRERDEVDIDNVGQRFPRRHHTLDAGHTTLRVYVHVATDERGAMRH